MGQDNFRRRLICFFSKCDCQTRADQDAKPATGTTIQISGNIHNIAQLFIKFYSVDGTD